MERTLNWLRENGCTVVAKTEHWNHWAKRRVDLFGFIDVLAVDRDRLLAIQVSDDEHHAGHVQKILANAAARELAYHMEIEIWSWGLRGARGKRKLWTRRVEPLTVRLLPQGSLLAEKITQGTWDVAHAPTTMKGKTLMELHNEGKL
jgi:hypothetical protein